MSNSASTLPSQVSLTVNAVTNVETVENCNNGRLELRPASTRGLSNFAIVKDSRIPLGSIFRFKLKNISGDIRRKADPYAAGEPLYFAAIYLLGNGDIEVIHPRLGANDPLGDGIERTFGGYIASKPKGAEQLILIVSKSFVDFSFYDSVGVSRSPKSPLEALLSQSGSKTRDAETIIPDEPNAWGVLRVDLDIID